MTIKREKRNGMDYRRFDVHLYLKPNLIKYIRMYCLKNDLGVSNFVRRLLIQWANKQVKEDWLEKEDVIRK